jgi:hypothetical protein
VIDPLRRLLERADAREPFFSADEVAVWARDVLEQLLSTGLLRAAANTGSVVCDACAGDHVEEVRYLESPPGTGLRAYIRCPVEGRVAVPLERLRCWEANYRRVAQLTASALDTAGGAEELVASRVWLLGKMALAGRPYEIFLCRGLTWADGAEVVNRAARVQASTSLVIMVLGAPPDRAIWAGDVPPVLPLSALIALNGARLSIDRGQVEDAVAKGRKTKPRGVPTASFPTPPGASWADVRVVVADLHVRVDVRDTRKELTFQEAGFEDKRRRGVPDRHWRLLKLLAVHGGILPSARDRSRNNLKQNVSDLGRRLTNLLHIPGRPFKYVSKTHRYEAILKISSGEGLLFPTPDGLTWVQVTIEEVRPGVIAVSADTADPVGVFTRPADEADGPGTWEAAVQPSVLKHVYDLRSLRLADADGRPNAAGDALLAVLRGGGKVPKPKNDQAMLSLCRILSDVMQIHESPFQFSAGQKMWSALFEAVSTAPTATGHK